MTWTTDLRLGIAATTAAESGGLLAFRPEPGAVYAPAEIGIHGLVMPEQPDEAVALALYTVAEGIETVMAAQFRYRARSERILDRIEDCLVHSWTKRAGGTLNGVGLVLSNWSSGASLGQDTNSRISRSANFYLTVHRPLANNRT